jgi:tryptophan-rich sensory protein
MSDYVGSNWPVILVAAMAAFAVAAVGGMLTEIGAWYHSLRFPAWKPPNWAFGPVWTVIFTLCVAAAVMAWVGARSPGRRWLWLKSCVIGISP